MIARIWRGVTPKSKADEYAEHQNKTGVTDYLATEGNLGVHIFRRTEGDVGHFLVLTFWDSVESIKKFAGEDYEKARYYPDDAKYLLEFPEKVEHYEVMYSSGNE